MGWFDEQIRQRMARDDAAFADAFDSLAGVVMGDRLADALNDQMCIRDSARRGHQDLRPAALPGQVLGAGVAHGHRGVAGLEQHGHGAAHHQAAAHHGHPLARCV